MVQCPTAQSQQCCSAYCRTACHNQLTATAAVDNQSLVRVLVRAVASHLLQIMKPHSFLQQAHAGVRLPAAYEHFFNHRQEHYNLKQLLCSILGTKPLPSLACEGSDSADELKQAYAEAAADEPESSAAGEARAAAAASPQLLQSSPPDSKWVIFTSTTPDLNMGYVLPGGGCSHAFAKYCCASTSDGCHVCPHSDTCLSAAASR